MAEPSLVTRRLWRPGRTLSLTLTPLEALTPPPGLRLPSGPAPSPVSPLVPPPSQPQAELLDRVRHAIRILHYSQRTEKAYVYWVRRFVVHHGRRHPAEMGTDEIRSFLSHLAVHGRVSASTQNQALNALLFLYGLRGAPRKAYYV